jgi:signal transduction histidine kinase
MMSPSRIPLIPEFASLSSSSPSKQLDLPVAEAPTPSEPEPPMAMGPTKRVDPVVDELMQLRESLHELIAPLSAVVGFSDLLLDDVATDEEKRRHARLVHEAGRELEQKIRRILGDVRRGLRRSDPHLI